MVTSIVSRNSCTDFTLTSLGSRTLPLDSGSALVEVREKKAAQGTASMPTAVAFDTQACRPDVGVAMGAAQCVHAKHRLDPQSRNLPRRSQRSARRERRALIDDMAAHVAHAARNP